MTLKILLDTNKKMEYIELRNIQNEYDLKVKELQKEFAVFVEKYKNEFPKNRK